MWGVGLALSVALNVIVLVLLTSSAVVVIVKSIIFSVSVFFTYFAVAGAFGLNNLLPYFAVKSSTLRFTCLSSLAVTLNVTCSPSPTLWLVREISNVGACVSGASVGVTGSLLSEVTVPLLLVTTVSAVIGFPGRASVTVTVAVPPLVVPVPISLVPS